MHRITSEQIASLISLRHALHSKPELSGAETETAQRISAELQERGVDRLWTGLGGHGVAAEFTGKTPGPTILLRCELDGLPICEISDLPYRSRVEGRGHLCGHDGHMASLLGVATYLGMHRPAQGRVILLFQPAEETGAGAKAVIDDPRWPEIRPDFAFAYHNVPGRPLGEVGLRPGPSNCASRGMQIQLEGKSAHAAEPENGLSPGEPIATLMQTLPKLAEGVIGDDALALATLTHARLGTPAFGISPADGEVWVTLRTMTNDRMARLVADAEACVAQVTGMLRVNTTWHDVFRAIENDADATDLVRQAASALGLVRHEMPLPMRWSEDFGRIGDDGAKSALIYVGAGETKPQLHNPDYDFPDELIPITTDLFLEILDQLLGTNPI